MAIATAPAASAATTGGMKRPSGRTSENTTKPAVAATATIGALSKPSIARMPNFRNRPATIAITIGCGIQSMILRNAPLRPSASISTPVTT